MTLYKQNWGAVSAAHTYNGVPYFRLDNYQDLKPYWYDGPNQDKSSKTDNQDRLESLYNAELSRRKRFTAIDKILK